MLGVLSPENRQNEIWASGSGRIGEREGTENIVDKKKESGEDYAKKILEFLEAA